MSGHIEQIEKLSQELQKVNPKQERIQVILDTLKVDHSEVYERLQNDSQSVVYLAERQLTKFKSSINVLSPEEKLMLQKAFLGNPRLKSQMQKLGVQFK